MLVKKMYGEREQFLTTFNPATQILAAKHTDNAFFGTAPTLGLMKVTYGENMPVMWLLPQLYDLCEFTSVKKMDEQQATFLAEIIATEFGYLKASEILLFFYRFKSGKYGKFYGSVDPMVITTALREFLKERNAAIAKHNSEVQAQERAEMYKDAISPQEFCKKRGYPQFTTITEIMQYEAQNKLQGQT